MFQQQPDPLADIVDPAPPAVFFMVRDMGIANLEFVEFIVNRLDQLLGLLALPLFQVCPLQ